MRTPLQHWKKNSAVKNTGPFMLIWNYNPEGGP
jgi:hypothetical protein